MPKTLVLWDIDGTILHSGGAGMAALQTALADVFGERGSIEGIEFAGRTDPWIVRRIFERFGIEFTSSSFERYIDRYVEILPSVMRERGAHVLPGAEALIREISGQSDVVQGLLTGNLLRGARTKLGYHNLWEYFPVGAFADDSEIRNHLGPFALTRAEAHWGEAFPKERVWIVGDTPHDIACARAANLKVLAVATGSSRSTELDSHRPDAVLENLSDRSRFWSAVLA